MKCSASPDPTGPRTAGFTLPELLIAATLFVLLLGGIVTANLFGLRMLQITQTKLDTSDRARKAVGQMTDEIRDCSSTWIGNVSNGTLVALLDGETQSGAGLLIYPTASTSNFIAYYVNTADHTFRRSTQTPGSTKVLAWTVTNALAFSAEDYLGNILTNSQNNRVIHMKLKCYQPATKQVPADYYKIETSITRRGSD